MYDNPMSVVLLMPDIQLTYLASKAIHCNLNELISRLQFPINVGF